MAKNMTNRRFFLIDGDNHPYTALNGIELLTETDTVLFFYSANLNPEKLKLITQNSPAQVQFIESVRIGKNALDFQIIVELGVLIGQKKADCAYIISQDQGYLAAVESLRSHHGSAFREVDLRDSIEDCFPFMFLLKPQSKNQLHSALVREYGQSHGHTLYHHLKKIFTPPENALPAQETAAALPQPQYPEALPSTAPLPAIELANWPEETADAAESEAADTAAESDTAAEPLSETAPLPPVQEATSPVQEDSLAVPLQKIAEPEAESNHIIITREETTMSNEDKILEAMQQAGVPLNNGKIVELTRLDKKEVEKAMKQLKKEERIISPKRCYWQPNHV